MVAGLNGLRWFSIRVGASSQAVVQPGLFNSRPAPFGASSTINVLGLT